MTNYTRDRIKSAARSAIMIIGRFVFALGMRAMGIRDKPIAPASPWHNGFAERLIGSIQRGCPDLLIICGEAHLRRVLSTYATYYN